LRPYVPVGTKRTSIVSTAPWRRIAEWRFRSTHFSTWH